MTFFSHLTPNVIRTIGVLVGMLITASVLIRVLQSKLSEKNAKEIAIRIRSWWVIAGLLCVSIAVGRQLSLLFLCFVSFLALKEYFSLIATRRADRRVLFWAYLANLVQYYWIYVGWYGMFIIFIPVYLFLFLPLRMVIIGETKEFLKAVSTIHWGLMTTVFSISHGAYLLVLPADRNPAGGGPGLLLFLVMLTELNDIFQFIWGKALGRHKVIPKVSPNKTVEGLLGGVVTTTGISVLLAPYLTPITLGHSVLIGIIISLGGFIGDVTVSAIKRDIGVKDSGSIIPGHGGILDRIDSLTYTAPIFFHFMYYHYY